MLFIGHLPESRRSFPSISLLSSCQLFLHRADSIVITKRNRQFTDLEALLGTAILVATAMFVMWLSVRVFATRDVL